MVTTKRELEAIGCFIFIRRGLITGKDRNYHRRWHRFVTIRTIRMYSVGVDLKCGDKKS